jgi:signal-transduction protein with cAMP-binding, CBS, and nucleotidyltransferase domain
MPVVQPRHILSGMLVNEAMRRQIVQLPAAAAVARGINHLLKYKVNALLIIAADQRPAGVVSKTDLIAAYYAGLPIDTPLGDIMVSPPLTCYPDDPIESALDRMRACGVHRLYVTGSEPASMVGTLSYTDVVALLYRYCRSCPKSTSRKGGAAKPENEEWRLRVKDVMTASVVSFPESARIAQVIEGLMAHRFGAVLISGAQGAGTGVISKTDLIRAYHHGVGLDAPADSVMTAPVVTWDQGAFLWEALRYMFVKDVQRLFVHSGDPLRVIGVLSLSDAARMRSGSCRACMPSRFITSE